MANNKRLSKGLGNIFGEDIDTVLNDIKNNESTYKGNAVKIKVSEIRPNPYQPRKQFDQAALKELADSIVEHGVFNPILVRKSIQGYELIAGERRLRASKLANQKEIPAIILNFDDKGMMEVSILENIQREDLSPIEEARAYQQLIEKLSYTQDALSKRVAKSRTYITNTLRLLKLPLKVQDMVQSGKLSYGHARALINIDNEDTLIDLANRVIKDGLTVRDIEKLSQAKKKSTNKKTVKKEKSPYLKEVKKTLEDKLATQVDVDENKIVIHFSNTKQLNRILENLDCLDR